MCSIKKIFLKILQNSEDSTRAGLSFLMKLQALAHNFFLKKKALVQVFFCKFCHGVVNTNVFSRP